MVETAGAPRDRSNGPGPKPLQTLPAAIKKVMAWIKRPKPRSA